MAEVFAYRHEVDERIERLLDVLTGDAAREAAQIVETGIQHEQQHQELILTDIKYLFSCNPLWPVYRAVPNAAAQVRRAVGWSRYEGDVVEVGYSGQEVCFDNERPRHRVLLQPFELNEHLVSNGEYLQFMDDQRLRAPRTLAVARLEHDSHGEVAGAVVLGEAGRRMAGIHAGRFARRSIWRSPFATSAISRPMHLHVGRVRDCPPNSSGSTPRSPAR